MLWDSEWDMNKICNPHDLISTNHNVGPPFDSQVELVHYWFYDCWLVGYSVNSAICVL